MNADQIVARFRSRKWNRCEPLATARLTAMVLADELRLFGSRAELCRQFQRSDSMAWAAQRRISALESTEPWFKHRMNALRSELKPK